MATADRLQTLRWLNEDLFGEHDAILHYLTHGWAMAATYGPAIESIARDEMRHFKWLAHTIIRLGGLPDFQVPDVESPLSAQAMLEADVRAETVAIAQYRDHQDHIPDPQVRRLLGRILVDETDHLRQFEGWAKEVADAPWPEPSAASQALAERIQPLVDLEYRAVLQSLWQSFIHRHLGAIGSDWEERAIDEMKHLGWLGAALGADGTAPVFAADAVHAIAEPSPDAEEIAAYHRLAQACPPNSALGAIIERIRQREAYQLSPLNRVGAEFTVGSLMVEEDAE